MARIILVSEYLRGGKQSARLANRTRYFATRPGVELLRDEDDKIPATKKQDEFVQSLLRRFPKTEELIEYEDYIENPTIGNASEFITRALEENRYQVQNTKTYADYIARNTYVS